MKKWFAKKDKKNIAAPMDPVVRHSRVVGLYMNVRIAHTVQGGNLCWAQ